MVHALDAVFDRFSVPLAGFLFVRTAFWLQYSLAGTSPFDFLDLFPGLFAFDSRRAGRQQETASVAPRAYVALGQLARRIFPGTGASLIHRDGKSRGSVLDRRPVVV